MVSSIKEFAHLQIPLEDVLEATNNFADKNILGKGDFGRVYKGQLLQSGKLVKIAARRLDRKHPQGVVEFWTEISVLSILSHENLVTLIGFCDEKDEKIIINSYNAKGSLLMHLSNPTLTWIQRLNISIGIARALSYIHNLDGHSCSVLYRNINSSTILLDDKFVAKLSGFEYSIKYSVYQMNQVLLLEAIGTKGYMDPAIEKTGGVTQKSDIYSFGVVLWEVLCGRKAFISNEDEDNRFLASLAKYHYENRTLNDIIHPDLRKQMTLKSLTSFSEAAYSCLKDDRVQRPDMNSIVRELENALELQLPYENSKRNLKHLKIQLSDLKIPLGDIMLATDNFSEAYRVGGTAYCDLYKAELDHFDKLNPSSVEGTNKGGLPKRRSTVVIKRILAREDQVDEEAFITELEMLTTCKHRNIVTLVGFCDEGSEMVLVIDHTSNGYLDDYWNNVKDKSVLTWAKRLKICVDVAHALKYLHYEMEDQKTIIHRDITSENIALDENWGAKIVDLGLSVFLPPNQDDDALYHKYSHGVGTYIDPEYEETCKLKRESDVYSFGVVLFEVLCGRVAYDEIYEKESEQGLAHVARRNIKKGLIEEMVDSIIKEESGLNQDSLDKFIEIAYQCTAQTQDQRPTMNVVINELEHALFLQERVQLSNKDEIFDEIEKPVELKLTHESSKKNLKHLKIQLGDLKIRLGDIMLATDNFSEAYWIRRTGFYDLYKAELDHFDKVHPSSVEGKNKGGLPKRRSTVVIKRILAREDEHEEVFISELEMLTTCKHRNIVTLLGFCDEGSEMVLVIEHASNGYLDDYWNCVNNKSVLTWTKRLKICLDLAHALKYLHYEMEEQKTIINRDIKCQYIALDENWGAKIVDFGLSVFLPPNQHDDSLYHEYISGTPAYMDPEYENEGKLKRESDVYSFGVVLFEVLCGRVAYDEIYTKENEQGLAHVARRNMKKGLIEEMVDSIIKEESGLNKDSLDKFIKIAYQCTAETQDRRPTMNVVVGELEYALFLQERVQFSSMDEIFDEIDKPVELKMTRESNRNKLEHLKIPLSEVMLATDNLSKAYFTIATIYYDTYEVELDHYDTLYRSCFEGKNNGELPKRQKTVVIRRLIPREDKLGEEVFFTEIEMLSKCHHPNIVTLLGFCNEGSEMILIIDHASNGYLGECLENMKHKLTLTWTKRLKICLGVAHGLKYLHYEMEDQKTIINCVIKRGNIVLDENWVAKIRYFGFSVFLSPNQDDDSPHLDNFLRINEYTDPEFQKTGKLKRESDVYSFGLLLFEILFGDRAYDEKYMKEDENSLASVARRRFREGTLMEMIDPIIMEGNGDYNFTLNRGPNKNCLDKFIKIAYECLAETQDQRPTMKVVAKELKKALFFQENNKDDPRISLRDIAMATENFHDDNCIGRGGFGNVYKGKVPKGDGSDTIVAKRLDTTRGQGEHQFRNELQILFKYKHENVIRLVGYCDEKDAKVIVYEYASRGSLDRYLNNARLTWMKRLNICIDVATALEFLHGGLATQAAVIHRDIKTENILLNNEWKAKLADYGLSLISAINQETNYVIDHACGTLGYVDPVYRKSGLLTMESDIYSFGVVLFEILCGRSTFKIHKDEDQFLPSFIRQRFDEGKHNEVVFEDIKTEIVPEALTAFQTIAYRCLHDDREQRPTAKEVLEQLKKALEFQEDDSCMGTVLVLE